MKSVGSSSNLVFSQAAHLHLSTPPPTSSLIPGPRASNNSNCSNNHRGFATNSGRIKNQGNHFWFSEPPFPELNLALFSLPTRDQALLISRWYFENATPTYRVLHQPSVETIINAGLYAGGDPSCKRLGDKSVCAVVFMVWALGCQYPLVEKEEEKQAYGRMS